MRAHPILLPLLALALPACCSARGPIAVAKVPGPDMSHVMAAIGRFGSAHACPISEQDVLTSSHVWNFGARPVRAGELTPAPAAEPCRVSTDIPELRERADLQHACGAGIASVSISGDHDRLIYQISYVADWTGRPMARTQAHVEAAQLARQSCEILRSVYPTKRCTYAVRDGRGHPVCISEVAEDGSGSTVCVGVVGEDPRPLKPFVVARAGMGR